MKKQFQTAVTAIMTLAVIAIPPAIMLTRNFSTESSTDAANFSELSTNEEQDAWVESESNEFDLVRVDDKIDKLELHNNTLTVCSMDEANEMIQNGEDSYKKNGALRVVDNSNYAKKVLGEMANVSRSGNVNVLESKSYIYHMMLNSVDYFNTARGSMVYSFGNSEPVKTEFMTNIEEQYACEKEYYADGSVGELHVFDGKEYIINEELGINDVCYCGEPSGSNISDNNRVVMLDEGELLRINRKDITNLAVSGNSCLFPQQYAMSKLYDFDNWTITGSEELIGRKCAVIEGAKDGASFKMLVDINYGFMLKYEEFSANGDITSYTETIELENDITLNKEMAELKS